MGSHRRRGGWEREENNRACVPCLSQQRGELGQRGSVSPGPLKEGLLQLSVVVGWGQGRRAPGHREAKWQECPGSTGSNSMETLTASCAIEGEARGGTTEKVTRKGSVRLLRRVTDIWNMLSRRVTGWGKLLGFSRVGWGRGRLQKLKEVSKQKEFEKGWRNNEKCKLDPEFLFSVSQASPRPVLTCF